MLTLIVFVAIMAGLVSSVDYSETCRKWAHKQNRKARRKNRRV